VNVIVCGEEATFDTWATWVLADEQDVDEVLWYRVTVKVELPPVQETLTLSGWLTLTGFGVMEPRVTPEGAVLTVREIVAVAVLLVPSFTVRVTVNGEPVALVGVQLIDGELAEEHPGGRLVQV